MDFEKVQDPLKSLDEICEPDKRQKLFLGISLNGNHAKLSRIKLNRRVPVEVRQLFETAKNLSLYSWFVYRFHQVSELTAYSALEMALRLRYEKEVGKKRRVLDLDMRKKTTGLIIIDLAAYRNETEKSKKSLEVDRVLLTAVNRFRLIRRLNKKSESSKRTDIVSGIVDSFAILRNELAHGSSTLHPNSIATLQVVAEVINQIYE